MVHFRRILPTIFSNENYTILQVQHLVAPSLSWTMHPIVWQSSTYCTAVPSITSFHPPHLKPLHVWLQHIWITLKQIEFGKSSTPLPLGIPNELILPGHWVSKCSSILFRVTRSTHQEMTHVDHYEVLPYICFKYVDQNSEMDTNVFSLLVNRHSPGGRTWTFIKIEAWSAQMSHTHIIALRWSNKPCIQICSLLNYACFLQFQLPL